MATRMTVTTRMATGVPDDLLFLEIASTVASSRPRTPSPAPAVRIGRVRKADSSIKDLPNAKKCRLYRKDVKIQIEKEIQDLNLLEKENQGLRAEEVAIQKRLQEMREVYLDFLNTSKIQFMPQRKAPLTSQYTEPPTPQYAAPPTPQYAVPTTTQYAAPLTPPDSELGCPFHSISPNDVACLGPEVFAPATPAYMEVWEPLPEIDVLEILAADNVEETLINLNEILQ